MTTTVATALSAATTRLVEAEVSSAALDASLLLADVLGVPKIELRLQPDRVLDSSQVAAFEGLLTERIARRPMGQLLGRMEFWSLDFLVTADTLCPRPETEGLVECAVELLCGIPEPVVVDVGTGTGCIAVALATEIPGALLYATDISAAALAVADANALRHGVSDRVRRRLGSYLSPLAAELPPGSVDLVVSNPPYVSRSEAGSIDPEVLWEPAAAIFSDGRPESVYAAIARQAAPLVKDGGALAFELPGAGSEAVVAAVDGESGWTVEKIHPDLAGLPRVLVARRSPRRA